MVKKNPEKEPSKPAKPAGSATAFSYAERKKLLMSFERRNYFRIYAIKSKNGKFSVMFHHSAVFFAKKIAPEIGSEAQLREDKDYDSPSRYGMVSYPSFKKLAEKLVEKGLAKEVGDAGNGIFYIQLKERIPKADFQMMLEEDEAMYGTANSRILPKLCYPELNARMKELDETVFHVIRKMDPAVRSMRGEQIDNFVQNLITEYVYATRAQDNAKVFLQNMLHLIDKLQGRFVALSWTRTLKPETCDKMSLQISRVRETIMKELTREIYKETSTKIIGKKKK